MLSPPKTDDRLQRTLFVHEAIAAVQAIRVAEQLGVLERLSQGPTDSVGLAEHCGISARGAVALLSALAGLGVLEATGDGQYRACDGPHLPAELETLWSQLETVIRTGEPCFNGGEPADAAAYYPRIVPWLRSLFAPAAQRFAELVARPKMRVVDLGSGSAPWSIAVAKRNPTSRVTAVDLPSVLVATRQAAVSAGCDAQFTFLAGDIFTTNDWMADGYDLAIVGNLCHLFDSATNARLLERTFHALRPQGRVAILDAIPDESGDGPRNVVLYGLGLLLRTRSGGAYPFSSYASWLRGAGFHAIERVDLSASPAISLITAERSGTSSPRKPDEVPESAANDHPMF